MKKILKFFLYFLTTIVCFKEAYAKDHGRQYTVSNDYSIIRDFSSGSELVYSYSAGNSTISIVDTTATPCQSIILPYGFEIKDMEKKGNYLYFCGSKYDTVLNIKKAVFGYIDLYYFSGNSLKYMIIDDIETLKKMDYFTNYSDRHVAMVGTGYHGNDFVVDALYDPNSAPTWFFTYDSIPDTFYRMDDIASTYNKVVVSMKGQGSTVGKLLFFNKPVLQGRSFINTNSTSAFSISVPSSPTSEILLAKYPNDTLYAVYNINSENIIISKYVGTSLNRVNKFYHVDDCDLIDVRWDYLKKGFYMILHSAYAGSINSSVWHILNLNNSFINPISLSSAFYNRQHLSSIDVSYVGDPMFIVSGHRNITIQTVFWYYENFQSHCCTTTERNLYRISNYYHFEYDLELSGLGCSRIPQTMNTVEQSKTVTTICSLSKDE